MPLSCCILSYSSSAVLDGHRHYYDRSLQEHARCTYVVNNNNCYSWLVWLFLVLGKASTVCSWCRFDWQTYWLKNLEILWTVLVELMFPEQLLVIVVLEVYQHYTNTAVLDTCIAAAVYSLLVARQYSGSSRQWVPVASKCEHACLNKIKMRHVIVNQVVWKRWGSDNVDHRSP